jgi:hypothetical protein
MGDLIEWMDSRNWNGRGAKEIDGIDAEGFYFPLEIPCLVEGIESKDKMPD